MAEKTRKTPKKPKTQKTLKVTLVKSPIGFHKSQAAVVQGMGLRRLRHTVELVDTPESRGMIEKVRHLVRVDG
jgi:large subunit ribosomal protein L30